MHQCAVLPRPCAKVTSASAATASVMITLFMVVFLSVLKNAIVAENLQEDFDFQPQRAGETGEIRGSS